MRIQQKTRAKSRKNQKKEVEKRNIMKMIHHGQKGFTLIELLIVVAILGIIAAVIIPNISAFVATGNVAAANTEAENVKTAALAYFADHSEWPTDSNALITGNYTVGTLKASYHFNTDGFIDGVGNPYPESPSAGGTTSSGYTNIRWDTSLPPGQQKWVRD